MLNPLMSGAKELRDVSRFLRVGEAWLVGSALWLKHVVYKHVHILHFQYMYCMMTWCYDHVKCRDLQIWKTLVNLFKLSLVTEGVQTMMTNRSEPSTLDSRSLAFRTAEKDRKGVDAKQRFMKSRKRIGCWFLVAKNRTRIGCWSWCGWKKICTIWDRWYSRWNLCTNGRFSISSAWLDFFHQQFQFGLVDPGCNAGEVLPNEDVEGADQEPGSWEWVERRVSALSHWWTKSIKIWDVWRIEHPGISSLTSGWGRILCVNNSRSIWELCKIVLLTAIPCHTIDPCVFDLGVFSTRCEDAIEHLLEYAKCKLLQMWEDPGG